MKILLASGSPRRRELLATTGVPFTLATIADVDESYPADLAAGDVAAYLSELKSRAYTPALAPTLAAGDVLLTADTTVILDNQVLGKPRDKADATGMLRQLSGRQHMVITAVTLRSYEFCKTIAARTHVEFRPLLGSEIEHYVDHHHPFDKAGGYGIQDWIGQVGVVAINGSYTNVIGLPVSHLFEHFPEIFRGRK